MKKGYLEQSRDLGNSLILVAPLLMIYEAGLLMGSQALNGVDFMTVFVLKQWGVRGLVIANVGIFFLLVAIASFRKKEKRFDPGVVPLVVGESTLYALALGLVVTSIMQKLPGLQTGARSLSPVDAVIASLGAGVNEELVFRLGLFSLILWAISEQKKAGALAAAAFISSVLFSLAHYLPGGESFHVYTFVYRTLAGLIFAGLFVWRGFAIAVYTHAIYDIVVLLRPSLS